MRRRAHDWAWHLERMAEYHPQAPHQHPKWLRGKQQEMAALDAAPERMRELVHEHNVTAGRQAWIAEQQAAQKADRCQHGKYRARCGHCARAAL